MTKTEVVIKNTHHQQRKICYSSRTKTERKIGHIGRSKHNSELTRSTMGEHTKPKLHTSRPSGAENTTQTVCKRDSGETGDPNDQNNIASQEAAATTVGPKHEGFFMKAKPSQTHSHEQTQRTTHRVHDDGRNVAHTN